MLFDSKILSLVNTSSPDFYNLLLDKIPAIIYVNTVLIAGKPDSLINIWSNNYAEKIIGYSREDIDALGNNFFSKVMHPDDLEIITKSVSLPIDSLNNVTLLQRLKPKGENEYKWFYGTGITLEMHEGNLPKTSVSVVIEITKSMYTENQLTAALKEINRLKHELKYQVLTNREKEILKFIANGLTDSEIAKKLFISAATTKTHRNKILKKLNIKNTASLVAFATECGIN